MGVKAEKADGSAVTVNAKAVILATGGYAHNEEMLAKYNDFLPTNIYSGVPMGNVGDGLTMAVAVGAKNFDAPGLQLVYVSYDCYCGINEESGLIVSEDGERVVSDTAVLLRDELLTWVRAGGVTMQMLERALGAKSLESMVFEDGKLIYVRTGEVFATYNAETGELIDCDSGLVVATLDMSSGKIRPRHEVKDDGLADDDGVDSEFAG